ncbi:MAG: DUF929 family protein, partial [Chloroflexota bacterium]
AAAAARRSRRRPARAWWRGPWLPAGIVVLILGVVAGFVLISQRAGGAATAASSAGTTRVVDLVAHVSPSVVESVGAGGLPNPLKPIAGASPLKGANGKPEVLYVGAEYCPYCAGERWSIVQALSRFGTFANLSLTTSSSTDINPDTPTFTFVGSRYSSPYIDFASVETQNRHQAPLQTPSAAQQGLLAKYDQAGSIPFVDLGNRYVTVGSGFNIGVLSGQSWQRIAGRLNDASAPSTRGIIGNANYLTAAICRLSKGQPGAVCSSPAIRKLDGQLGG